MEETQVTLRDTIEQNFDNVVDSAQIQPEATGETRSRDDSGKFVSKEATPDAAPVAEAVAAPVVAEPTPARPRPSSWKKDYEEHWGMLASDPKLSQLQEYILKRESDYATGVSTYKQEAERAKELQDALAPFMPDLQQHNIQPTQWISNLGNAHRTLALGTPQQKQQMFLQLAQDYGVDLSPLTGGQSDPQVQYLMQQLNTISSDLNSFKSAQQQAEENQVRQIYQEFVSDTENYPHFESVKEDMAQLLESGLAKDLPTAYQKAIRLNESAWEAEQARKQQAEEAQRQQAAAKARAQAVSPRTATPSGAVSTGKKDRVSLLSDAFDNVAVGRL